MKITSYILALSVALLTVAFAADFSGKLIDATCNDQKQQTKAASCDATSATTSFALDVNGKVYKLDANGNSKASTALRDRADRATNPASKSMPASYTAKVTGTEKEGTLEVESITVQ